MKTGGLSKKINRLKKILKAMESTLIAFSGGVDSTFLLKVAKDTLGNKVTAATAKSQIFPFGELKAAKEIARNFGVEHIVVEIQQLSLKKFKDNSPERCYFCKKELFSKFKRLAKEKGLKHILDASNYDDLSDFRPGKRAAREFSVRSPLEEAGFSKEDIRKAARKLGLDVWNKPSDACLATRIPYGVKISEKRLKRIEKAEGFLRDLGLRGARVRDHEPIARIEVAQKDICLLSKSNIRREVVKKLKGLGYAYVTLDMEGYRTGSLNFAR